MPSSRDPSDPAVRALPTLPPTEFRAAVPSFRRHQALPQRRASIQHPLPRGWHACSVHATNHHSPRLASSALQTRFCAKYGGGCELAATCQIHKEDRVVLAVLACFHRRGHFRFKLSALPRQWSPGRRIQRLRRERTLTACQCRGSVRLIFGDVHRSITHVGLVSGVHLRTFARHDRTWTSIIV